MIEFRTRRQRHPLIKDSQRRCAFGNRMNRCVRATKCFRYYNSDSGMWSNRDPIGEDGGIHLYSMSYNQPTQRIDKLGLSKCSFADPCQEYIRRNPNPYETNSIEIRRKRGFVVCCGGDKTACIYPPDHDEWYGPNAFPHATRLSHECIMEHEEYHVKDPGVVCPEGGGVAAIKV